MSDKLEWKDPPSASLGRSSAKWQKRISLLRARPDEWAVIGQAPHSATGAYLQRQYGSQGYEFTSRKNGSGWDVYGRYVGNGAA